MFINSNYDDISIQSDESQLFSIRNLIWKRRFNMYSDIKDNWALVVKNKFILNDIDAFGRIENGNIIWIKNFQLCQFVIKILPNITQYFTMIQNTGHDWISPLYYDLHQDRNWCSINNSFDRLINNKYLLYLFTDNYDATMINSDYDIIEAIPLGLALQKKRNSIANKHRFGHIDNYEKQEIKISEIYRNMLFKDKYENRIFKIYVDIHYDNISYLNKWNKYMGIDYKHNLKYITKRSNDSDSILKMYSNQWNNFKQSYRLYVLNQVKQIKNQSLITYQTELFNARILQYDQFKNRSKYIFSLSPFGVGLDCLRTWESLLFGNIVIVQSGPLDILYKKHNFPVVMVESFNHINFTMLQYWYQKYKSLVTVNNNDTLKRLQMNYWMNYIRNKTRHKVEFIKRYEAKN